jgi:uncharacterized lipoprotein YehR (DUF1307 family)
MKRHGKILKTGLSFVIAILLVVALIGCAQPETVEPSDEPGYADAIAEGILQSFNTGDYAACSQHFDEAMKKAMPEATFQDLRTQVQNTLGEYISKEYSGKELNVQGIYTAVIYKAEFSKEPAGVQVRIVFLETEDSVFVSGLWFE